MAARRKAPELITTRERAHLEASTIAADANGVKCISEFLGDLEAT